MKTIRLIIIGDVQGVGYRGWMKREALRKNVMGWVKNREDGTVEALLQGDDKNVDELVAIARRGPLTSLVDDVTEEEKEVNPSLSTFEVIY